jgi:tetratricopeptide (TPR) repeat protein/tRNA A-37 threonylcarbamoyl transferase component Bud32
MTDPRARLAEALQDRYRIDREVGAGGMATVFLAEDLKHRRKVAVKVLRQELAASLGAQRFLREIEIAAQLQHPHILPLLDSGAAGDFLYFVMPFVEGESLRQRLAREGALPVQEATRLLAEITDALAHAHRRGVVHRDIKPDNVMLSERHALVTDFGVAKAVSEAGSKHEVTSVGIALGTPTYMAPEQASADPSLDHRADLYAIGCMAYEMLTGRPPFTGSSAQQVLMAHMTRTPEPPSALRPGLPPALEQAVLRCLAKSPAERFQEADELLAALDPLSRSSDTTPIATAPVAVVAMPDRWYGHPVRVAASYAVAGAGVLAAVWGLGRLVGLPGWALPAATAVVVAGLPVMLVTGLLERRRAVARATGMYRVSGERPVEGLFTWRRAVVGGIAALGLLGAVTGGYATMRTLGIGPAGTLVSSGKLAAKDAVLVAEFENRTADSTLGASVSEALRIDLSQSPVISVLGAEDASRTLRQMGRDGAHLTGDVAREVATRAGAKAMVLGEIGSVGGGLVLLARLVSTADGSELVAIRETAAAPDELLPALDRLSKRLRERIGESLKGLRNTDALERVSTASLEALRLYTQGVRAADAGRYDDAVGPLEQAVAVDSTFAMAWRKLAVVLGNGGTARARQMEAATNAYQLRDRLPELERYLATAYYFSFVENDRDRAVAAYRAALQLDPTDQASLNNLAVELSAWGQYDEADSLIRVGLQTSRSASLYSVLTNVQLGQRRGDSALAVLDQLRRDLPGTPEEPVLRAAVLSATGRYDSATVLYGAVLASPGAPPLVAQNASMGLAATQAVRGQLAEAARERERTAAIARRRGNPGAVLGMAIQNAVERLLVAGDSAGAHRLLVEAEAKMPLDSLPPAERPYGALVGAYALSGDVARAKALAAEYEREVPAVLRANRQPRRYMDAALALVERRPADAVAAIRAFRADGCRDCGWYEEALAWEMAGLPDSARMALEHQVDREGRLNSVIGDAPRLAQSRRRLGALYEERGDTAKAIAQYTAFLDLWRKADPELQPQVRDVKERLGRLVGEQSR